MTMPTPNQGENYAAFMARCMRAGNEMGACATAWDAAAKKASARSAVDFIANDWQKPKQKD